MLPLGSPRRLLAASAGAASAATTATATGARISFRNTRPPLPSDACPIGDAEESSTSAEERLHATEDAEPAKYQWRARAGASWRRARQGPQGRNG